MHLRRYLFWLIFLACLVATEVDAAELVRSATLIESMPIQGVTLATPPKEAVERLLAAGFHAGPVRRFEDWTERELLFERGGRGAPEGESWITLARYKGRLTQITETFNRPKQKFDAAAEIGTVQNHFGIGRDDPKCRANAHGAGSRRVQDRTASNDVDLVFGIQVLTITMNRYATRKKDYKASLQ